jgi:hypothetical protein
MVGWLSEGRISGHWHSLDEHRGTHILCDGKLHCFDIGSDRIVEVDAIQLHLTPANDHVPSQLHLSEFRLSDDLLPKDVSLVPNCHTPMNMAKLITFLVSELVGQDNPKLRSYWNRMNSCPDLELVEFSCFLSDLFSLILSCAGLKMNEPPLATVKRFCEIHCANPQGSPKDTMWRLASDLINDLGELSMSVPSLRAAAFTDVVRDLVHYFESLHLEGEWNPLTEWRNIEKSAGLEECSRANWRRIAGVIVMF